MIPYNSLPKAGITTPFQVNMQSLTPNQLFIEGTLAQKQTQPQPAAQPSALHPGNTVVVPEGRVQACNALDIALCTFIFPVGFSTSVCMHKIVHVRL